MSSAAPEILASLLGGDTPLPGQWRFFCDRTTNAYPMGPVTPTAFSCSWALNGFGAATVALPVDSLALPPEELLRPFGWRLWAIYEDTPVWGGFSTGVVDQAGATVTLTLLELPGYLTRRQYDAAGGATYTQIEQTQIARDLAAPLADVLVAIVTDPGGGFRRDRAYEYLEGQHRGELLTNLAGVINGPEFRSEYSWYLNPSTAYPWVHIAPWPQCTLRIAYPRVGATTGLAVSVPASALEYTGTWDADQFRTRTFAVGELPQDAPEGTPRPCVVENRPQAGMPRIDKVDTWDGVILASTLRERAATNATIYADPVFELQASGLVSSPPLLSYKVGDSVAVSITDPLLPDGFTTTGRLTELAVEAATGKASWTITVTQPPGLPRFSLSRRLGRLDRRTERLFQRNLQEIPL